MTVMISDPVDFVTTFPDADIADFETGLRSAEPFFQRISGNHINEEAAAPVVDGAIFGPLSFDYGLPPSTYKPLADACRKFSWKRFNLELQKMGEHKKVTVEGNDVFPGTLDIHFVHRTRPEGPKRKAILLIHGWPGSFHEFKEAAPKLDEAGYDLVIPSLPGYCFSSSPPVYGGAPDSPPWTVTQTATCFDGIMQKLGYSEYFAQGGDWGSLVSRRIAQLFPQRCVAIHVNFLMISPSQFPSKEQYDALSEDEARGFDRLKAFIERGIAYAEMQGTTPYTLGAALSSHSIALLVYLSEKFLRWSDHECRPTLDDIIGTVAMYYLNNHVTSSFWFYYNRKLPKGDNDEILKTRVTVPTAVFMGREEIYIPPRSIVEPVLNIASWGASPKGGHFLALEQPDLFAKDVDRFFSQYK